MDVEQLEIMKVIEFPKNKEIAEKLKNNKLDVAIGILELLSEEGSDYHILVSKEAPIRETKHLKYYSSSNIKNYLKKKYGFKDLNYTVNFFVDADIEEGE
mgnify:CR=1 FL=1|jgi:hypothetical protein